MLGRSIPATLSLVVLCFVTLTSEAQARRRTLILITTGEKVMEIADIPADSPAKKTFADAKIGYRCEHFGLFWLAIWTWDGEFCIYSDEENSLVVDSASAIAEITGVPVSKIKKPLFYSFPPLLVIGAAFLTLAVLAKMLDVRAEARRRRESLQRAASLNELMGAGPPPLDDDRAGGGLAPIGLQDGTGSEPWDQDGTGNAQDAGAPVRKYTDEELLGDGRFAQEEDTEKEGTMGAVVVSDDEALFDALMDALCCVMVSDGKVSKSERKHVGEVMKIVKCPWSAGEINGRVNTFVAQVKQKKYRLLLDETCEKLRALRGQGKERLVEASLNAVARADGDFDEAEKKVCDQLMSALVS